MHREIRHAKPRSYVPRGAVKTEERTNHGLRKKAKYLFFFFFFSSSREENSEGPCQQWQFEEVNRNSNCVIYEMLFLVTSRRAQTMGHCTLCEREQLQE